MKWFIVILIGLLAALLLESGLLAYAMYVLLALLILSRLLARNWIASVKAVRLLRPKRGHAVTELPGVAMSVEIGAKMQVLITVKNEGWMPVPWVLLEDLLPAFALDKKYPRLKIKGKRVQIAMMRGGGDTKLKYDIECLMRGYYQIGPVVMENGDLFGLHRRYKVETEPQFLLVYPRLVPLTGYELASRRPIGDVRLMHRLFEDPTRIAGVREYQPGDSLNRVHWKATARTGKLHSKIYEPSTMTGATLLLDFHSEGYHSRGEPFRSELAITTTASLAGAICELGQPVGLMTNARDAADRIRLGGWKHEALSRGEARTDTQMKEENDRLAPMVVQTRRGMEQLQRIRETLARAELTEGLTFTDLVQEAVGRLPRDATVIAVLPEVSVASAVALGLLRRQGFAITIVLILMDEGKIEKAMGRLFAEGVRDVRHLSNEDALPDLFTRRYQGITMF